jgi:hypothetical protein
MGRPCSAVTSTIRASVCTLGVAAAVAQSFGVQAAKLQPPPNIPLVIAFNSRPQPGVCGDSVFP